jgi:hypothetical protein
VRSRHDETNTPRTNVASLSGREGTERAFLALCIASPEEGTTALEALDLDEYFSSGLLRRVAAYLREGNLNEPMAGRDGQGADGDPALKQLLAELIVEAGGEDVNTAMLEVQRLQLDLARVEREIQRARGMDRGDVSELAKHRARIKHEFDRANERALEESGHT